VKLHPASESWLRLKRATSSDASSSPEHDTEKMDTNIEFTRYWLLNTRKSETSDLRGFRNKSCSTKSLERDSKKVITL
jgi:hypothetical protein